MNKLLNIGLVILLSLTNFTKVSAYSDINTDNPNDSKNEEMFNYCDVDLASYKVGDIITLYQNGNEKVVIEYLSYIPNEVINSRASNFTNWSAGAIPTGTHEIMPHVTKHGVTTSFYMRVRASTNSSGKYSFDFEKLWGFSTNHSGSVKKVNYVKPSSYKAGVNYSGTVGIFGLKEEFNGYFYAEFNTSGNMRVLWHTPY